MNEEVFRNISKIIERDSKSTTYKFALLRGTIDIIQDNSPYITIKENIVEIPLGLLIEKWLVYYYTIFDSDIYLPQINGETTQIAFHEQFKPIIKFYKSKGHISAFYNEIRNKDISIEVNQTFFTLVKKLKDTITNMPMRYIGRSLSQDYYSIYKYYPPGRIHNSLQQNLSWLIKGFGYFSIPREYFEAFKILGSFMTGTDSIIFKWAEFSVTASGRKISSEKVINEILKNPVTEREIKNSKDLYKKLLKQDSQVFCVWTGKHINTYDIDHLIPFSIFKNNDMWNLLPSQSSINNRKRDKIPSIETLKKAEELIIYYWELICDKQRDYFLDQVQVSLLGNLPKDNWQKSAFSQLLNTSKYLIEVRGYQPWKPLFNI